jgi:hypothetical protein
MLSVVADGREHEGNAKIRQYLPLQGLRCRFQALRPDLPFQHPDLRPPLLHHPRPRLRLLRLRLHLRPPLLVRRWQRESSIRAPSHRRQFLRLPAYMIRTSEINPIADHAHRSFLHAE